MKECKFKVGDKVVYTHSTATLDGYRYDTIYTVKWCRYDRPKDEWLLEVRGMTPFRWQWKFELAKNQIIKDIIKDL